MSSLLTASDLAHEVKVVWLEDPEELDYVRQALDKTPGAGASRATTVTGA